MILSQRLQKVEPSPTLAISAKAKAIKATGEKVFALAAGEPDFPTPENICKAAIDAIKAGHTTYVPSAGIPPLREAICKRYKQEYNLDYQDNQVVVSTGAKQCLYNGIACLVDSRSEVIIQAPYWVSYPAMVTLNGGTPVIIEPPDQGFGLNLDAISRAISKNTRAIILNSPSNPTGHLLSDSDLSSVAKLAIDNDLVVISDDIYEKLVFDGRKFVSIVQLEPSIIDRCLLINGFSKTYAMTGWRLGYAVGPVELIAGMRKVQDQSTSCATSFAQYGGLEALNTPSGVIDEMVKVFDSRRIKTVERLNKIEGVSCEKPAGSFYLFADFSLVLGKKYKGQEVKSTLDLAGVLLDQERVAVIPGEAFGAPGFLRLSFATSQADLDEATTRIKKVIDSLE